MGPRTEDQDRQDDEPELMFGFEPADEPTDVRHAPDERSWARLAENEDSRRAYLD